MTIPKEQPSESIMTERVIASTPQLVFDAWTDPKKLEKWWGPPGSIVRSVDVDLKIGGHYRIGIEQPNHEIYYVFGVYEELDPPKKLSFTWRWEQPEMDFGISRVTIQLAPHQVGTLLNLTHSQLPTQDIKIAHEEGWIGILENFIEFIEN